MTRLSAQNPVHPSSLTREQLFRALGVLIGAACGDALGAPFEFGGPGQWFARFADRVLGGKGEMIGGGGFNWAPGEFTDDTQMAVALAESIIECGGVDPDHLWVSFRAWREGATDVGINTSMVLSQENRHGAAERAHERQNGRSASNGCIMRIGPVGIWGVTAGRDSPDADRTDAHDAAVARAAAVLALVGALRRAVPVLLREHHAGVDAHVGGSLAPCAERDPEVVGVDSAALDDGFRQCDGHLGVVGELAGRPVETAATDHLALAAQHAVREPCEPLPRTAELERCTQCVAARGTDEHAERAEQLLTRE